MGCVPGIKRSLDHRVDDESMQKARPMDGRAVRVEAEMMAWF